MIPVPIFLDAMQGVNGGIKIVSPEYNIGINRKSLVAQLTTATTVVT